MQPLIGVSGRSATEEGRRLDGIESGYVRAVASAGGLPVVLPVLRPEMAGAMIRKVDGLLLAGGRDIEARHYGEAPAEEAETPEPERDAWEMAVLTEALEAQLPVLAVCRGLQLLNVVAGGTLIQHLPSVSRLAHRQADRHAEFAHFVTVKRDSTLASVVGEGEVGVNSLHHQAIDRLGSGLTAVAWSDDGVVEAVESVYPARVIGVQWHPELLVEGGRHARLFTWLTAGASRQLSFSDRRPQLSASVGPESGASPSSAVA
ncbi:MAG: gamma-glutamyl-gamma-aminobutyrate hydrolase family protein [Actinomycetota bacterium]|nr:gamma-glutamyl-gamma-aminobutyrate hydrolase family protein [Actinomycetota bacterium]